MQPQCPAQSLIPGRYLINTEQTEAAKTQHFQNTDVTQNSVIHTQFISAFDRYSKCPFFNTRSMVKNLKYIERYTYKKNPTQKQNWATQKISILIKH